MAISSYSLGRNASEPVPANALDMGGVDTRISTPQ